jgi:hypothetical protein
LTVVAQNASLQQILHEITTAAGVKVEGFSTDQRIFGSYGPAPARDVINQLLSGTGYNVLMIGDSGEGTPRQIVLTFHAGAAGATQPGGVQPNPNGEEEAAEEPEPEPPEQPPVNNGRFRNQPPGAPGAPGRTPQQMLEELQQRRQQNGQQNGQPNTPPN